MPKTAGTSECLYSTVKNVSGSSKRLMFLPPHGRTLAANEEYTFFGTPTEAIRGKSANGVAAKRNLDALESALTGGVLEVIRTPNPVFYDKTRDEVMMVKLAGGKIYAVSPCWHKEPQSSSSSL